MKVGSRSCPRTKSDGMSCEHGSVRVSKTTTTFEEAVVSEDWEAAYDATIEMRAILKRLGPRWEWTDEGPRGGDE